MGSISKQFTAGAILILEQEHKLSKYFPGFPGGDEIPLLYLLQHRSGMTEYNYFPQLSPAYSGFVARGDYELIVQELMGLKLNFTPGTQYQYSNTNSLLLGMIVSKVSGKPLGEFLQKYIFDPLHMTNMHQGYAEHEYTAQDNSIDRSYVWNLHWIAGPGTLTSTVMDLEQWDQAVKKPGIFTPASLSQMFAPSPINSNGSAYVCGWVISTLNGHRYVWHNGGVGGFRAMNAVFPDDDVEIIILTNSDIALYAPEQLVEQLFELVK